MNVSAYILVETDPGKNREACRKIETIPGVISAYPVTGPYDVIAAVTFKHLENLTGIILPALQVVPGVKKTITCIREDIG
jgi:DNA-binding Lrp family transcriptional regulator